MRERYDGLKAGDNVTCSGFPGKVVALCDWSDTAVEVRLASGVVCVHAGSRDVVKCYKGESPFVLSAFMGRDEVIYILAWNAVGGYWTVHERGPLVAVGRR